MGTGEGGICPAVLVAIRCVPPPPPCLFQTRLPCVCIASDSAAVFFSSFFRGFLHHCAAVPMDAVKRLVKLSFKV